jgi:NADPH:quinone reductase
MATSIPATMCALQQTSLNGPQDLRLITDVPVRPQARATS